MAFPDIVTHATSSESTSTTTHTVNIPAHNSGDVLLLDMAFVAGNITVNSVGTVNGVSWTPVFDVNHGNNSIQQRVWSLRATSNQVGATTITVTLASGRGSSAICLVLRDVDHVNVIENATATGTSAASNPPSLTPSWGARDTLWLATACNIDAGNTITASPANYTFQEYVIVGGSLGHHLIVNYREINTATQDPGSYTLTNSNDWIAATLAVCPVVNRAANRSTQLRRQMKRRA